MFTLKYSNSPRQVTFEPLISFSIKFAGFNTYGISICNCSLNSLAISVHRATKKETMSQTDYSAEVSTEHNLQSVIV